MEHIMDKDKKHREVEDIENICEIYNKQGKKDINPPQTQKNQPGKQHKMTPKPISIHDNYKSADKLKNKVAIITGGDSGIGRAIVYHFAAEGAKIVYVYLNEHKDAKEVNQYLIEHGYDFLALAGDLSDPNFSKEIIEKAINKFGQINCIVNNAAQQVVTTDFLTITPEQLQNTFAINLFSYFYLTQAGIPHLSDGDCIINTTSVTAYRGSSHLIDYSASKGAIVSFTRSLSKILIKKRIRVNGVAPGPVWTPLIPASFKSEEVAAFGSHSPIGKPAQPADIAPSFVFLASDDSTFISGQIIHPNGGEIVNT